MNLSKSCAAFRLTAQGLFEKYPRVYFWTVTFYSLHSDWECSALFGKFLKHLQDVVGRTGWGGVRVVELHVNHGAHYHLLVTERLAVDLVRRVGRCYGIGRIHVEKADAGTIDYLGKYLSKGRVGTRTESGRRARKWAAFGDVPRVRVRDLENMSPMWVYRREHKLPFLNIRDEKHLPLAWIISVEQFRACYFALKRKQYGDAIKLSQGRLEVGILGEYHQRSKDALISQPF